MYIKIVKSPPVLPLWAEVRESKLNACIYRALRTDAVFLRHRLFDGQDVTSLLCFTWGHRWMPTNRWATKADLCLKPSVKEGSDRDEVQTFVSRWFLTRKYKFLEVNKCASFSDLGAGTGAWPWVSVTGSEPGRNFRASERWSHTEVKQKALPSAASQSK